MALSHRRAVCLHLALDLHNKGGQSVNRRHIFKLTRRFYSRSTLSLHVTTCNLTVDTTIRQDAVHDLCSAANIRDKAYLSTQSHDLQLEIVLAWRDCAFPKWHLIDAETSRPAFRNKAGFLARLRLRSQQTVWQ